MQSKGPIFIFRSRGIPGRARGLSTSSVALLLALALACLLTVAHMLAAHGHSSASSAAGRQLLEQSSIIELGDGVDRVVVLKGDEKGLDGMGQQRLVWLNSHVGTDYPGAATMLQHWLQHYLQTLGFKREQLIMAIWANSTSPEAVAERRAVKELLDKWGVSYSEHSSPYEPETQMKLFLEMLNERLQSLEDWIFYADSDEFHSYPGGATVEELVKAAEAKGKNWIQGRFIDRVAAGGQLAALQELGSIFEQYPYNCHIIRCIAKGETSKAVGYKAYWRGCIGNHHVVKPEIAREFFGPAEPGKKSMRWTVGVAAEDLFDLTPYSKYADRYQYPNQPRDPALWQLSQHTAVVPVYHFKWLPTVVKNAADRYEFFKGNTTTGGQPRFAYYDESRKIRDFVAGGRIDLQKGHCSLTTPVLVKGKQTGLPKC